MVGFDFLVILVPLLPLVGFLAIALNVNRFSRGVAGFIACGSVLLAFLLSTYLFINMLGMPEEQRAIQVVVFDWIKTGNFSAPFSFLIDAVSIIMLLVITGVGFLIHVYSIGYMHDDAAFNRFFSYLNLFIFFMLLLVMGSNYLMMFVGWEGVGLCSYLLIGFWFKDQDYMNAANKAFIMNRIGDLGLILGVILIFAVFGSIQYTDVFAKAYEGGEGSTAITLITILLFVGAMGKSAQIPLYTWLPDAMAGPTPVSALIHAATMVTAGVYMVARNNVLYTLSPASLSLVLVIGLVTALFAATIAIAQNDIKKVLAYSTVSQLGLMFVALGVGAYASGIFHMATHAFFKALLFLAAGSVIHSMGGEQDIRKMGGLKKYLPVTWIVFLIGVLAISGIPPFAGFFSKDEILAKAFESNVIVWGIALLASLITVFYMFRLLFLTFFNSSRASTETISHIHESPKSMTVPLMILAVLSTVGGFMGVSETLAGSDRIGKFLDPVFKNSFLLVEHQTLSQGTEYMLMATVMGLTLVMIGWAYSRYVSKQHVPAEEGSSLGSMHQLVYKKYFIDELYQNVVVKPLYWISDALYDWIERSGIDRLINGVASSVGKAGRLTRLLQTGNIGFYIFIMVIGIILILAANTMIR
ncbi:MAG TPA: NADH-quinone oxidoreductase subunit L [Cyclobacteriaceae bacterium]|nr:NADH-quinone oxidoreductase subunit L [Cyclobacteriaceae bacterium]